MTVRLHLCNLTFNMKSSVFYKASKLPRAYLSSLGQTILESQERLESKLDAILNFLQGSTVSDKQTYEHVMQELVQGNRKPFDEYFKNGGKVPKKEISG